MNYGNVFIFMRQIVFICSFCNFIIIGLSVIDSQVLVLHHTERLEDESVRIVVAACGVKQSPFGYKATLGDTLLADDG